MTSCDNSSNSTTCGDFWYSDFKKETLGHDEAIWDNYADMFTLDNMYCVHLIKYLPFDKDSYYTGNAFIQNDTMHIEINEELKFSFKTVREMTPVLKPCNIYFTSKTIPKAVYWGDKQIIKTGPTFLDL